MQNSAILPAQIQISSSYVMNAEVIQVQYSSQVVSDQEILQSIANFLKSSIEEMRDARKHTHSTLDLFKQS